MTVQAPSPPIPLVSRRLFMGIALGFLAILVTLLAGVVVIWRSQRAIERDLERIVLVEEPTSAAAYEMEINTLGAGLAIQKYVLGGDPADLQRVTKDNADFARHLLEYERLATTPEDRELARAIAGLHSRFRAAGAALIKTRGRSDQERVAAQSEFTRLRVELDALLDEGIQARTRSDLLAALEDAETNLRHLREVSLVLIGTAGLVSLLAGGAVYQLSVSLRDASADELRLVVQRLQASEARRGTLLRRLVTAQEEERARIARELHDELGQDLAALSLGLAALQRRGPAAAQDQSEFEREVKALQRLTLDLADAVHVVAWRLRPTLLDDLGLEDALANLAEKWTERSGVPVDLFCELWGRRLPREIETTLYRLTQEALTNAAKHAEARSVNVVVNLRPDLVRLVVEDDGRGFDADDALEHGPSRGRLGLVGMRERIELAGGSLEIDSAPGEGTSLLAHLPLDPQARDGAVA